MGYGKMQKIALGIQKFQKKTILKFCRSLPKVSSKLKFSAVSMDASSMVKNMAENLFNFCSSFASGDSSSVPISTIEMWFRNTQQKLAQNPNLFKK